MALIWGGFLLFAAWCLNGTIVEDTDWSRIGGRNGVFASLGRYLTIDWTLLPELIVPTIETFMMASVGTVLGCFFSLPVAWLGAVPSTYLRAHETKADLLCPPLPAKKNV